jgi:hypothetical protein
MLIAATMAILVNGDVRAINVALGLQDVDRALQLAQAFEDQRARFHAPYIIHVNDATVDQIEVITEFRRYVVTAEEQLRQGNWLFAQDARAAQAALRSWRGRLSLIARLRFHPQNTLSTVPLYDVTIGRPDVAPLDVVRTPVTALLSGMPGDFNAPIMGATIEGIFDAASVGQTARPVIVSLAGQDVARVTVDFAKLE